MRIIAFWLFLLYFSFFISNTCLQANESAYLLGPRDVIKLKIFVSGELEQEVNLTVSTEGYINVPFIGQTLAKGKSPNELEKEITIPLAEDYFVDPAVHISITDYQSRRFYISGAVKKPGLHIMTSEANLLKLIAKAGGVLPSRGNNAYILRETKTDENDETADPDNPGQELNDQLKVDIQELLDRGNLKQNIQLQPGDIVYIPLQTEVNLSESKVYVEGKVARPGVFDYQPGMTALNACILAGGFDKYAAPNRTIVVRKQEDGKQKTFQIDLNEVKKGDIPDLELKPGDLVHVPHSWL